MNEQWGEKCLITCSPVCVLVVSLFPVCDSRASLKALWGRKNRMIVPVRLCGCFGLFTFVFIRTIVCDVVDTALKSYSSTYNTWWFFLGFFAKISAAFQGTLLRGKSSCSSVTMLSRGAVNSFATALSRYSHTPNLGHIVDWDKPRDLRSGTVRFWDHELFFFLW